MNSSDSGPLGFIDDIADTVSKTVKTITNTITGSNSNNNSSVVNNGSGSSVSSSISNNNSASTATSNNNDNGNKRIIVAPPSSNSQFEDEPKATATALEPQVKDKKAAKAQALKITSDLTEFYKLRAKKPSLYNYDGRGNLVIRDPNGSIQSTIKLPKYRQLTHGEFDDLEQKRREEIIAAQEYYDTKMEELRAVIQDFNHGRALQNAVKEAQLNVEEADRRRSQVFYPEVHVGYIDPPLYKDIYPDALGKNGQRILDDFIVIKRFVASHSISNYTKAMTEDEEANEEAKAVEEAEEEVRIGNGEEPGIKEVNKGISNVPRAAPTSNTIIVFNRPDDNEYGYMANDWPVDINWKGVKYFTVDQALAAEKARYFGRPADVTEVMKTRSATTMRSISRKMGEAPEPQIPGQPAPAETDGEKAVRAKKNTEWENVRYQILVSILTAKFRQHEMLGKLLGETGDAILARADHRDIEDGIGLAITDPRNAIQSKWRGKNLLGKALMEVRELLRTGSEDLTREEAQVVTDETINEKEAEAAAKAKAALIIRRRKSAKTAPAAAMPNL